MMHHRSTLLGTFLITIILLCACGRNQMVTANATVTPTAAPSVPTEVSGAGTLEPRVQQTRTAPPTPLPPTPLPPTPLPSTPLPPTPTATPIPPESYPAGANVDDIKISKYTWAQSPNYAHDQTIFGLFKPSGKLDGDWVAVRTQDGGAQWVSSGISGKGEREATIRIILSADYLRDRTLFIVSESLYTFQKRVLWRSADGGESWTQVSVADGPQVIFTAVPYVHSETMRLANDVVVLVDTPTLALVPINPNDQTRCLFKRRLINSSDGGGYGTLECTTDDGQTWTSIKLDGGGVTVILSPNYATDQTFLYARYGGPGRETTQNGIFRSTDGGKTFEKLFHIGEKILTMSPATIKVMLQTGVYPQPTPSATP